MNRVLLHFALFLSTAFGVALPSFAQTAPAPASGHAPYQMQMPKPTNLQVLPKDISGQQLMATMMSFRKALGVECSFCHAVDPQTHRPNFASDAKPDKEIARTMIRMTQEINSKYVSTINDPDATPAEKTVTCGSCHRGKSMPPPFVPGATSQQQHEMPKPQ
jgi:Photosynthetic reaction centre cytochrome C subunit